MKPITKLLTGAFCACLLAVGLTACEKHTHSYTEEVTAPTCTEQGYTTHTCSCGHSYVDTYVDELGHSYTEEVTAPTCTEQGYTTHTCSCGHSYKDDYVDELGHSYTEEVTAPTCTEQGYTTHTCSCGHSYVDTYVDEIGHEFTNYESDENATYTEDGTKTATCNRDNCNEKDTVTDVGSMLESKIEFATLSVDGTNVSGRVKNAIVEYDFNEEIAEIGLSSFVVSKDAYGSQTYLTKSVPLSAGENEFFVFEMQGGNIIKKYKISIYRNPIYTVQFENGYFPNQEIEEGDLVEEPTSEPTKLGYTFGGWDYDFTKPVEQGATIYGKWTVLPEMSNFEFTSTASTCAITGLIDKTVSTVVIPDSVTSIGENVFGYCSSLTSITVSENNTVYKTVDGNLYTKDETTLVQYAIGKTATSFIIPNSVTSIGDWAFFGCNALTEIIIPDNVTSIGDMAFGICSSLTSVTIGDGVTNIAHGAFYGCRSLRIVCITDLGSWCNISFHNFYANPLSLGASLYLNNELLINLEIPNTVTSIGSGAFDCYRSLTSVVIPDSVTSIGEYAFRDCRNLTSVVIPDSVTSIGENTFRLCSGLMSVGIGDGVTSIGENAFWGCSSLTSIVIPDSVTNIGGGVFAGCSSLTSITVGANNANYKSIDGNLYTKDGTTLVQYAIGKKATTFTIPDGVTSIGDEAFYNCSSLTSIEIPNSVTSIGDYAFSGSSSLTSVVIPKSVMNIGVGVFSFYYTATIYCEVESQPSGWDLAWNSSNWIVYWYSENQPTTTGNYWHYDENGEIVVW